MPDDASALMTVEETAAYLRLAPWTIRHWVCQKKIPYVRLGRSVRFRRKDMERFVAKNLHAKAADRDADSTAAAAGSEQVAN